MPFTPAHVLAVLPARRVPGLVPAALVIGAMVPDAPYFLPVDVPREVLHSWRGALTLAPLLGFALWAIWEGLLAEPVADLSPEGLRRRMQPRAERPAVYSSALALTAGVYLSLLLGTTTHVVWDGLTHLPGWGTALMPWLLTPVAGLWLLNWVQLSCSVLGLLGIVLWARRWWRSAPLREAAPRQAPELLVRGAWIAVLALPVLAGATTAIRVGGDVMDLGYFSSIAAGGVLVSVVLLVAVLWWLVIATRRRTSAALVSGVQPRVDVAQGRGSDRLRSGTRPQ